uniref:VP1.6 n=1 Tax=Lychas mucronatus TaxID=172552 RepID=A0A0U1S5U5_LYCMC|nr:VP1.6 [Lychas mucronatus]
MSSSTGKYLILILVLISFAASFAREWSAADRNFINSPEGQMMLNRMEMFLANRERGYPWSEMENDSGRAAASKRQIRYHQCYFNPISCFRRRK